MPGKVFQCQRRVEFSETDAAGIVHFASFFLYMEQAEHTFLRSLGASVFTEEEGGAVASWPRVRAECDFLKAARFEDILDLHVSIEKLGNKSIVYLIECYHEGDAIARGRTTAVYCMVQNQQLRSIPIPESLRVHFAEFVRLPSD